MQVSNRSVLARVALGALAFVSASVKNANALDCGDNHQRTRSVDTIITQINRLRAPIERPSPEKAAAIIEQLRDAAWKQDRAAGERITTDPLYFAAKVYINANKTIELLSQAKGQSVAAQAVALFQVMNSAEYFKSAISEYVEFDGRRPKRLLDEKYLKSYYLDTLFVSTNISMYGQCLVRLLREPDEHR